MPDNKTEGRARGLTVLPAIAAYFAVCPSEGPMGYEIARVEGWAVRHLEDGSVVGTPLFADLEKGLLTTERLFDGLIRSGTIGSGPPFPTARDVDAALKRIGINKDAAA